MGAKQYRKDGRLYHILSSVLTLIFNGFAEAGKGMHPELFWLPASNEDGHKHVTQEKTTWTPH